MTITLTRTKAEESLIAQFAAAEPALPGGGRAKELRRQAIARFAAEGLPHRRIEQWKYTDLRERLRDIPAPARRSADTPSRAEIDAALGPVAGIDAWQLVFVDGFYEPSLSRPMTNGCGRLDTLAHALGRPGFEWLGDMVAGPAENGAVSALNVAFASDGALVRIPDGVELSKPVHLVLVDTAAGPASTVTHHAIEVGRNARAALIESHVAIGAAARHGNVAVSVRANDGAEVTHVKHLSGAAGDVHLSTLRAVLGEGASYRNFQLTAGSGLARHEIHAAFTGPDAKLDISGAFLGRGSDHIDTTLVVDHTTTGCESRELFKGVLDGRARGVFQGKVIVRPEAQKTDGKQMAQALMLSEDAEFDSKPELEIYADDVACGHGTTAAEIDPAMLFYLRSRGLPKLEARTMLIESFVGEAIEKVDDEAVRAALMAIAVAWLRGEERRSG